METALPSGSADSSSEYYRQINFCLIISTAAAFLTETAALLSLSVTVFFPAGLNTAVFSTAQFYVSLGIFAVAVVLAFKKLHPIVFIAVGAVIGVLLFGLIIFVHEFGHFFTAKLSGMTHDPLINLGGDYWVLFPWLGTYGFLAMERFLKLKCAPLLGLKGMDSSRPYFIQFRMSADRETFFQVLKEQAAQEIDPMSLVYPGEVPLFEKYDEFLPPELVQKGFAYGILDIEGMKQRILGW